jgi:hypothetical protein
MFRLKELDLVGFVVIVDGGGIEVDSGDRSPCELESSDLEGEFRTAPGDGTKGTLFVSGPEFVTISSALPGVEVEAATASFFLLLLENLSTAPC